MHKLQRATKCSKDPPKYPQNLAIAASYPFFIFLAAWLEVTVGQQGLCLPFPCLPSGHLDHSLISHLQTRAPLSIEGSQAPKLSSLHSLANL
jgi:hypothetical protein